MVPAAVRTAPRVLSRIVRQVIREPRTAALGAHMALWIVLTSVAARMTSLPKTVRLLTRGVRQPVSPNPSTDPQHLARTIDRVLRIELPIFRPRCWKRSLVLYRYLTRAGIECRINFGVRRNPDGTLAGHAWLERDGHPFLESDTAIGSYVVTFSLPGADGERAAAAPADVMYDTGR